MLISRLKKTASRMLVVVSLGVLGVLKGAEANGIPTLDFAYALGGSGKDHFRSITYDLDGNIYVVGDFQGTVDFDPGPQTRNLTASVGNGNAFITKLSSDGSLIWANYFQTRGASTAWSVQTDTNGNVYVGGSFSGTIDFDPGSGVYQVTSFGYYNGFALKLNKEGQLLWAKTQVGREVNTNAIAVDHIGNVYIGGLFRDTADFDPGIGTYNLTAVGWYDGFVSKLTENGELIWVKPVPGTSDERIHSLSLDPLGNVYAEGFSGAIKFDANGLQQWRKTFRPGLKNDGKITVDGAGSVYLAGNFGLTKLDPVDGSQIWSKSFSGSVNSVDTDVNGNIYLVGNFGGTIDSDPGSGTNLLRSAGGTDGFIVKLDQDANYVWSGSIGGSSTEQAYSLTATDHGEIYVTGFFFGQGDFDPGTSQKLLKPVGRNDGFILKFTFDIPNLNRPPVANAGADIAAECAGVTTAAQLDGSGSSDPDGDEITYAWSADGIEFGDATADIATGEFPLGETTVTLTVSDGEPLSDSDEAIVSIVDTTPPTINYTQTATELWPPNHNMATAIEGVSATDACGGDIVLNVTVSSDEDGMGGAGNTEGDWDVITDEDGSQSVALRAERSGNGDGREYTVVVTATDASGNSTEQTLTVAVPLSKGKGRGKEAVAPLATSLNQNYPNPFNAQTQISFDIASTGMVRLELFDITGRTIRTLVDQTYTPGRYRVTWDGRDGAGNEVASGMYIYRLSTGTDVMTKRLMLLR